jgi:succinate-acetate transporter protein
MTHDPTPLGLAGFSSIVMMVSAHYAGLVSTTAWICPLGLMCGIALLVSSVRNTHHIPANNFGVFGAFWIAIGIYSMFNPIDDDIITFLRIPLNIYVTIGLVASLYVSKAAFAVFVLLEAKLVLFIVGHLAGVPRIMRAGGIAGMACASVGYYSCASLILKPYVTLPLGKPLLSASKLPN